MSLRYQARDGEKMLFYVVDGIDTNEELFTTREEADAFAKTIKYGRIRICEVANVYNNGDGWNYDDYKDTFKPVITLSHWTEANYNKKALTK